MSARKSKFKRWSTNLEIHLNSEAGRWTPSTLLKSKILQGNNNILNNNNITYSTIEIVLNYSHHRQMQSGPASATNVIVATQASTKHPVEYNLNLSQQWDWLVRRCSLRISPPQIKLCQRNKQPLWAHLWCNMQEANLFHETLEGQDLLCQIDKHFYSMSQTVFWVWAV